MTLDYTASSNMGFLDDLNPIERSHNTQLLEIIAQPYYSSKLRYRSDYKSNKNRRGALHSRNNPNFQTPTIRIHQQYLNVTALYYIRVCLVTVENQRTQCRYIHPYDFEDVDVEEYNDRHNKAVWFPIQGEDLNGIKSFPNLRIVRKKADDLKQYGDFRVFDSPNGDSVQQLPLIKETVKEFNLGKAQLAFTVGQKIIGQDGVSSMVLYASTTVFSDEMIEHISKEPNTDDNPSESTTVTSQLSTSSSCRMYKYAPRHGHTSGGDEVLIFFTSKLKLKKYGELQVTFEWPTSDGFRSEHVVGLEVMDQMVSFRTPRLSFHINDVTPVNIILKQKKRVLEPLIFNYIPTGQCATCRTTVTRNMDPMEETNLAKRRRQDTLFAGDEETDSPIPTDENKSSIREANSKSDIETSRKASNSVSLSLSDNCVTELLLETLNNSVASLFTNNDLVPFLCLCRVFIRKRPQLLHLAIHNNHSDLVIQFIPLASITLLQQKNELGETVLLHAVRLNRVNIVKAILNKEKSDILLDNTNLDGQNIFHILSMNTEYEELLDLFLTRLAEKSMNIE